MRGTKVLNAWAGKVAGEVVCYRQQPNHRVAPSCGRLTPGCAGFEGSAMFYDVFLIQQPNHRVAVGQAT